MPSTTRVAPRIKRSKPYPKSGARECERRLKQQEKQNNERTDL